MNRAKKNIVIVGFNEIEINSINVPKLNEIHYVDSLSDTCKYQGYMLIVNNIDNKSVVELDKKYRKTFNKFERILLFNKNYNSDYKIDSWTRIERIGKELFLIDVLNYYDDWEEYKKDKEKGTIKVFNNNKKYELNRLYSYIKDYKCRKTSEIVNDLNINERTIQRYMHDLNNMYQNIGYDYSLNEWYFIW